MLFSVLLYVFETVKMKYFNKLGKQVSYDRTACVDKKDLIQNIKVLICFVLFIYFFFRNDFIYWQRFLRETEHDTHWLDYSQKINFTEKRQVQSAHFSGRQNTLQNTVLQAPKNGKHAYIYHLSDDTNHGSVTTFSIIKDVSHCHHEVIQDKVLIFALR